MVLRSKDVPLTHGLICKKIFRSRLLDGTQNSYISGVDELKINLGTKKRGNCDRRVDLPLIIILRLY